MGLDQAVLSGFESGGASGNGPLSKDEVEKLTRRLKKMEESITR